MLSNSTNMNSAGTRDLSPGTDADVEDTTDRLKARYIFAGLGMSGVAIGYALRVNLSVAIVTMVNYTAIQAGAAAQDVGVYPEGTCFAGQNVTTQKTQDGEFAWDEARQGYILAGFFYGYALGQLPGGILAERWGGKLVFGLGNFLAAALSVVSPFAARLSDDLFFAVRLLEGLGEGVTFPAVQFMISKWAPPQERSRFSIIFSGGYLGTVITLPVSGLLCSTSVGWPLVFYVFGGIGVLWYIPWLLFVYDTPAKHPRIDPAERRYIEASLGKVPAKRKLAIPWRRLLSTPGLWACVSMHLGIGWGFYTLLTSGPTYLANILHFDISTNSALSAVPYILGGLGSVVYSGILDYLITSGKVSKVNGYRIFNGITVVPPALTLIVITLVGCDVATIVALLAINGMCMGAQYTGNSMNLLAIAPNFSGTMLGISNTFANAAGILAPYAVGWLTNGNQTRTAWNTAFYIAAGIGLVTYAIYVLLATDKVQPWNDPPQEEESRGEGKQEHGLDNPVFDTERF